MILKRIADWAWHELGLYRLFIRCDRLHLWVHVNICTPVADWEIGDQ